MNKKVFFDSDVILDISTERKPFLSNSVHLLNLVEGKEYDGYTSSVIFTNVYYVQRKLSNHATAISFLKKLRLLLTVLNVEDTVIEKALNSEFSDFEDGVQFYTALEHKMDYIITRNTDYYKKSTIPVYTPTEFIKMIALKNATGHPVLFST